MFKNVDKKLKDIGFIKICEDDNQENKYGVSYRREDKQFNFNQILEIHHHSSGKHTITSYEEHVNSEGFNNAVGLSYEETKLAMKKYKEMKKRYKW